MLTIMQENIFNLLNPCTSYHQTEILKIQSNVFAFTGWITAAVPFLSEDWTGVLCARSTS
jgi:hypothetical protein